MRLATTDYPTDHCLSAALARGIRPAVGFTIPDDVVKDPDLSADEKRVILTSWASDASAVDDRPTLRWLLGTPEPVLFSEVRDALLRLDQRPA
jgi:hypothetical protein